jgi:hypothetical protein
MVRYLRSFALQLGTQIGCGTQSLRSPSPRLRREAAPSNIRPNPGRKFDASTGVSAIELVDLAARVRWRVGDAARRARGGCHRGTRGGRA